jgi:hypothetical protein
MFLDCRISGNQEDSLITVLLRFKQGDEEGDAIRLKEPALVTLDDEPFQSDSSGMTGFFYECQKPLSVFEGDHEIAITATNGKTYREKFSFKPLVLLDSLIQVNAADSLVLHFSGLDKVDYIRMVMTDTSFPGKGINRLSLVINGRLVIYKEELNGLKRGPIQMEITKESDVELQNGTKGGGRISIQYAIRRELVLEY